jgi:LemA protein
VKGAADFEKSTLTAVTEARARVGQVSGDAIKNATSDPESFRRFEKAQGDLSSALSRLLVVSENYPQLRATEAFRDLQAQLEGTENRIAVARRDYIEAVRAYNTELRTIPGRWIASIFYSDAKPMEAFTASAGSERPPNVKF